MQSRLAESRRSHRLEVERAFAQGLARHGRRFNNGPAVTWGQCNDEHYLCLEAGNITAPDDGRSYVDRRLAYISASWDGYGYRGKIPHVESQRFALDAAPWKTDGRYALLMLQHPGDRIVPSNYLEIMGGISEMLDGPIRARPHPLIEATTRSLAEDLSDASFAVTFCSNAAVESVLSGVPTVCLDEACSAWPVCSHDARKIVRPDRALWISELTWRNWTLEEIASGAMWDFMGQFE